MTNTVLSSLLQDEWHPNKNILASHDVTPQSHQKVWWIGKECGHEWEATVSHRTNGRGCPYCNGSRVLAGFNDLGTLRPIIAAQWHPTKNETLLPSHVSYGSKKRVWWVCEKGHEWDMPINSRSSSNQGCPYCSGKRVLVGYNDLATLYPVIAKQWHPIKNMPMTAHTVVGKSGKKVWWICDQGHEWNALIANRTGLNSGCPVCNGNQVVQGFNDLASQYPLLKGQWHPTKNGSLLPEHVTKGALKIIWWQCDKGHEWQARLTDRTRANPHGCPVCSNNTTLTGYNDLASQSPKLASQWHPTKNGILLPNEVNHQSNRMAWWLDPICGHEWEAVVSARSGPYNTGCPYCKGKKTLFGHNDLFTNRPDLAVEWHPTKNLPLSPKEVRVGSSKKVWWVCKKNHEYDASIYHRSTSNSGCPFCSYRVSKPEHEIADFLIENKLTILQTDRKILQNLELDIYIASHNLAIEFNGLYWHTENQGKDKTYHRAKYLACKALGIQLIQIWEDEWKKNPEQIKAMLLHKLGITQQEKVFARKTIITQLKKAEIEAFLEKHHVQGYAAGSHYLGLREKNTDELVSVLVLKKETNNTLNIIRYATSKNVVGGFTKLLKYAELTYKPARFITFSDHCVSDGGLYKNNGFVADKELAPDYRYVVNGERQHKFGYRLKRFRDDPNLQWDENMTERELAALNGLPRIWDAGKTRWVYDCMTK